MINWISDLLNFAPRQTWALEQIFEVLGDIGSKGLIATFTIVSQLFSFIVTEAPITPYGDELDLTGYSIVFEDEFDGNSVDWDVWQARYQGSYRYGYASKNQATVKDGSLYVTGEYKENGEYGAGWYTADLALQEQYKYGYYEIKAICNGDDAFWSAFWLRNDDCYTPEKSLGGPGGAEIDILEALCYPFGYSANKNTIHVAGIDGPDDKGTDSYFMPYFDVPTMYSEYNTYGLLWTEDEYIFYINGIETVRTSYGNGVCEEPLDVILTLCLPSHSGSVFYEGLMNRDKSLKSEFIVDYVRIYQLAPTAE